MAAPSGPTNYPVINRLLSNPRAFTFFQSVRLLEKYTRATRIGFQGPPRSEPMRFRAHTSLAFPISDIDEIVQQENPAGQPPIRYLVTGTFLGLYGSASPLPPSYSEYIIRYGDAGDDEDRERLRAFLDIYHHRIFSLFYRALSKYRYHLTFDMTGQDKFSHYMRCLIGRGTAGMPEGRPIPSLKMVRYAGLLTQQPKSAEGLRGMIADYFNGVKVRIQQCIGRWLNVEDANRLGQTFSGLGSDMIIGSRVYDTSGKFRVALGPVGLKEFTQLLPNGSRIKEFKELVKLYLLDELDFDVEIWLRGDEVPPIQLGNEKQPALLGWTSWAVEGPGPDRSVVFSLHRR